MTSAQGFGFAHFILSFQHDLSFICTQFCMKVEIIAECILLLYFWPASSDNRRWKKIFGLLFDWLLKAGSVVVDFLFIVTPIVGVCNCSMFCCTLLYVHSSIAIILMGKRELIALLNLSSWCLVMVEQLFLAVPRGCLQFVIVVFPDHTHLLFLL